MYLYLIISSEYRVALASYDSLSMCIRAYLLSVVDGTVPFTPSQLLTSADCVV
jgi:hypothetical protein